jgi:molybdopterin converting factor small subunit
MPQVQFTYALKRFYPTLQKMKVEGTTVREVVQALEKNHPGLPAYLIEENGALRKHVNIFVNNQMIKDRNSLKDKVAENDEIYVMQALSGG